ncbi:MAG: hypothetical protein IPN70_02290 [Candidatus Moraniibacteriota bacterium]|nr:MAG: hypothetical protein IPN70_02290 [Candidatus Moranbacteria bacterium]
MLSEKNFFSILNNQSNHFPGYNENQSEGDGKILERALFGGLTGFNKDSDTLLENRFESVSGEHDKNYYSKIFEIVRTRQPHNNPKNPPGHFPQQLLKEIVRTLAIKTRRIQPGDSITLPHPFLDVRLYTAVNSILDRREGVDAFIDFVLPNKTIRTVTLDATLQDIKNSFKADILFSLPPEIKRNFRRDTFIEDFVDTKRCTTFFYELSEKIVNVLTNPKNMVNIEERLAHPTKHVVPQDVLYCTGNTYRKNDMEVK